MLRSARITRSANKLRVVLFLEWNRVSNISPVIRSAEVRSAREYRCLRQAIIPDQPAKVSLSVSSRVQPECTLTEQQVSPRVGRYRIDERRQTWRACRRRRKD